MFTMYSNPFAYMFSEGGNVRQKTRQKKCSCGCNLVIKREGGKLVERCACGCKKSKK